MKQLVDHPFFPWLVCAAILSLLFLFFYPPMYVSIDEHQYLKNSLLLQNGELKSADPLVFCGGTFKGADYLSSYHIGKSFSLIPFTWGEFPFAMLSGLLIHLLNMLIFALILRRVYANPWLVSLFAFYPAFVWESRTLFSETLALTFLLGGVFFYLGREFKSLLVAGLFFGLAAFVRYETVLISLAFAIALFWNTRKDRFQWRHLFIAFVIGGAVAGLLLLGWNSFYHGSPFSTQVGSPAGFISSFPQPLFLNNLAVFVGILLVAFPLLIISPLRSQVLRLELILASLFTIFLFSQTTNISAFPFLSPLTITGRMRYLIPIAGLLLIVYAESISRFIPSFTKKIGAMNLSRLGIAMLLILGVGALSLSLLHQELLDKRATVGDQLYSATPSNALIIGSGDDCIYFLPPLSGERKYVKVNDAKQDVPLILAEYTGPIFVMQLRYSNTSDSGIRQDVIDKERMAMDAFISENKENLSQVFDTNTPHRLTIYQWK